MTKNELLSRHKEAIDKVLEDCRSYKRDRDKALASITDPALRAAAKK